MSESMAIEAASVMAPAPRPRAESDFATEAKLLFRVFSDLVKPSEEDDFLRELPRTLLAKFALFRRAWDAEGEIGARGSDLAGDTLERS